MPHPRFLLDQPMTGPGLYTLNRQESHHAVNVMRLREGDAVIVFDGRGNRAEAVLETADRAAAAVRVDGVHTEPHLPLSLTIATAIPKGKRWQTLVEKCTELGVDRIVPMLTERSVAKGEGDADKWRRWIVEAAKQSRRSWIPEIVEPVAADTIPDMARREQALLLVADGAGESPTAYRDLVGRTMRVVVMIGPEGGFSETERDGFLAKGGRAIRLSPFVLRVETAAATVCALIREMVL